jgi:hypothetical protein
MSVDERVEDNINSYYPNGPEIEEFANPEEAVQDFVERVVLPHLYELDRPYRPSERGDDQDSYQMRFIG